LSRSRRRFVHAPHRIVVEQPTTVSKSLGALAHVVVMSTAWPMQADLASADLLYLAVLKHAGPIPCCLMALPGPMILCVRDAALMNS
jgi:hypothetical protein